MSSASPVCPAESSVSSATPTSPTQSARLRSDSCETLSIRDPQTPVSSDHGRTHLNFDVLHIIMSLLSEPDEISRMMRTCRDLLDAGVPLLLLGVDIIIRLRREQVQSFCLFMLHDSPKRFRHFTKLTLMQPTYCDMSHEDTNLFAQVLRQAHRLKCINIACIDEVFGSFSEIVAALASNQSIETFIWSYDRDIFERPHKACGPYGAKMLSAMAAPLKEICVSFERYKIDQELGEVLGGFSSTLEVLRARSCTLNGFNVQFARLESLELETAAPLDITSLARVFPAVRDLRIDIGLDCVELEWLSIRASNLRAQPSLNMSLRTICGHVLALWSLGLKQRIHSLRVYLLDSRDLGLLQELLFDICPSHLEVQVRIECISLGDLVMLLGREIDVTLLDLVICFPVDRYMWDCPMITHAVLELLKTMSLNNRAVTQLDIRLYRPYHTSPPMKWPYREDPIFLYLRNRLDVLGFAQDVANILPALTKLIVYVDYVSGTSWDVEREFDGAVALKQTSWLQL